MATGWFDYLSLQMVPCFAGVRTVKKDKQAETRQAELNNQQQKQMVLYPFNNFWPKL